MHIHFGRHSDGLQPEIPATCVGKVTLGPAGFLHLLETQLGLPSPNAHPSETVFSYLECLREVSSPTRFFHRSFEVDPVNVSRTLLDWREQWYEAGWDGKFPDDVPARLADMAAIETLANDRVPLTTGQRLQRIVQALADRQTQIERVTLLTPLDELAFAWQQVLAALPCEPTPGLPSLPSAPLGTDLAIVQARLSSIAGKDEERQPAKETLRGDGSIVVVKASSRDLSAQAVAEFLLASTDGAQTLLVAERDGIILDNALERVGLPRCGFQYHTRFRAATQVLKLCLALIWAPTDPHRILQFLLHPIGPLPRWARSRLADAVAESPGVGGPLWLAALDDIERTQRERLEADGSEVERLRADIALWLECEKFDPSAGATLEALITRAQRVSSWASAQLVAQDSGAAESPLFGAAQAQAEALIAGLTRLRERGDESIGRLELERLIDEVTTETPDPSVFSEAGHVRATNSPAAVVTRWPTIVWWNLAPPSTTVSYPWSRGELAALRKSGVHLQEVDELLRQQNEQWLRPVLNATKQLVLVVHDHESGTHPIWTQIENLFDGVEALQIEPALLSGARALSSLAVPTRTLPLRPLPAPRRWWTLPADCPISRREIESYSSISALCDYPHDWVLQYPARLATGRAEDISDGSRLYGNLGHRLIESFFNTHKNWRSMSDAQVDAWAQTALPQIVEHEGAVLLDAGRGIDRQRISATIERALTQLLTHLRAAGIEHVVPEARAEVAFAGRQLTGTIDLLLTNGDGKKAVIDVKWSGRKFRSDLLRDNRALQLATYAYLQKTLDSSELWPPCGFFILASGDLITNDIELFPSGIVSPSQSGEGPSHLWQRLGVTYAWRLAQIEAGRIEVVTDLTEPDADSVPPANALESIKSGNRFDDYTKLTGWEPSQ